MFPANIAQVKLINAISISFKGLLTDFTSEVPTCSSEVLWGQIGRNLSVSLLGWGRWRGGGLSAFCLLCCAYGKKSQMISNPSPLLSLALSISLLPLHRNTPPTPPPPPAHHLATLYVRRSVNYVWCVCISLFALLTHFPLTWLQWPLFVSQRY